MNVNVSFPAVANRLATALAKYQEVNNVDEVEIAEILDTTVVQLIRWTTAIDPIKQEDMDKLIVRIGLNMLFITTGKGNPIAA